MKPSNNIWKAAGILVLGILLGWLIFGGSDEVDDEIHDHELSGDGQIWTCSMHPEIRRNEPGDCPICGMDLIPVDKEEISADPDMYRMSENAMSLANISTMTVGEGEVSREIRLNGKVVEDERNVYSQSTHIPGRIEELRVNFTGEQVNRGQVLAMVYSPELVTAQEELLQAAEIRESQPELFEAAKGKLRSWKIGEDQINRILSKKTPIERFPITADVEGIVTNKLVDLGDYVERGMPVYEISDLSRVWVLFDLYESEVGWVQEGSTVEYTIRSLPGQTFEGEISFIDPLLDSQTRVATARVEVGNNQGRFKPGMFASGTVKSGIGDAGGEKIVIPKSAVLWTGRRSVVYIKEDAENGAGFKMREITLGPSLGDAYVVEEGLEKGEKIVVNGTFTVDAAVQLAGKPSMMNPSGGAMSAGHDLGEMEQVASVPEEVIEISEEAKGALEEVVYSYLDLKDALVEDDYDAAQNQLADFQEKIAKVETSAFEEISGDAWKNYKSELESHLQHLISADDLADVREGFQEMSAVMIRLAANFKPLEETLYIQHCPMANRDRGADWLSLSEEIRNPYFGSAMLTCGEVTGTID